MIQSQLFAQLRQILKQHGPFKLLSRILENPDAKIMISGVRGALFELILSEIYKKKQLPMLVVLPSESEAESLASNLLAWGDQAEYLPASLTLAYMPQDPKIYGRQHLVLQKILAKECRLLCLSMRSFLSTYPSPEVLQGTTIKFIQGQSINSTSLQSELVTFGYSRVKQVTLEGEFAMRGEVCDIFMYGDELPKRIVFEWDKIEEIRSFDPYSQASIQTMNEVLIRPCINVDINSANKSILAYFHSHLNNLSSSPIVCIGEYERCLASEESLNNEYQSMHRKLSRDMNIPSPENILFTISELENDIQYILKFPLLFNPTSSYEENNQLESTLTQENDRLIPKAESKPIEAEITYQQVHLKSEFARNFFGNIAFFKEEVQNFAKAGYTIILSTETETQLKRLETLFKDLPVNIVLAKISHGFVLPLAQFMLVHEDELFGRKRRIPQSLKTVESQIIENFVDLDEGDFVVHLNHGIGRFIKIQRLNTGTNLRDYITIEYANEEFVLVPIEQVNLVQRYIGSQGNSPQLDRIGGTSWKRRKSQVSAHVEELAKELLALYSRRKKARGFAFPPDGELQMQFEASFSYEETKDQLICIDDVKSDMETPNPMDRLICGDVGYGKTEIALRAAFKAILAGKQVILLCPTTILAEQHYETAKSRMNSFPIHIAMLSRFVPRSQQKSIIEKLKKGTIDLAIGTHRIIQKDIQFKNLGLLIIDEEQRFGVKDKERVKHLKSSVDCLTLSATPIPRTLHMSLLKIRDISLLNTPPQNRRPIETEVQPYQEELVAQAIRREVERGGQVFYLHNRIQTLDDTVRSIESLVPEVLVERAHGQMNPIDLEDVMYRFIHGSFQVLITTTIIENGIDIPNANTIIIDRADMYGISQLYQLRGRVGRAERLAYAYLFYPAEKALSEVALKRLQIIGDYTDLGSGFKIAMKDLEIRGAGNLLGREQSGDIYSVGFDLYLRLLNDAIRALDDSQEDIPNEVFLEIDYSGYIPDTYIQNTIDKMEVYKGIASVNKQNELDSVYAEILDRFGPLPEEVLSLLALAEIRILCNKLNISMIRERNGWASVHFAKLAQINFDKVIEAIRRSGGTVRADPKHPEVLLFDTKSIGLKEKSEFLRERLLSIVD